jgi:hypothetical protein
MAIGRRSKAPWKGGSPPKKNKKGKLQKELGKLSWPPRGKEGKRGKS